MTIMTMPKQAYKRGNILLVLFPSSDLRTAKLRPVVVVQADNLQTGLEQVIVAMITSNKARMNHPSRIVIDLKTRDGQQTGLLSDSVVMTDNLATVANSEIDRQIGTVPMKAIDSALRHALGL